MNKNTEQQSQQVWHKVKTNSLTQGSKVEFSLTLQEKERQNQMKDQDKESKQSILSSFCKIYGAGHIEHKYLTLIFSLPNRL